MRTSLPFSLVLGFFAPLGMTHAGLIGNDLIDRPNRDGTNGALFMITTATDSGTLDTFSFFDNAGAGRQITPVIMRASGTGYEITGIGTTRTSDGSGIQSSPFGLVSGSDQFGLGYGLAWRDSSTAVVEYTNNGPGRLHFFENQTGIAVNDSFAAPRVFTREYSANGTVTESGSEIVGSTLANRSNSDGVAGAIFVLNDPFNSTGNLSRWSFFDDDGTGRQITPLLLGLNGVNWEILGQGTPRTSDGSGAQIFDFGLVAGSDATDPSIRFGFKDGSNGTNNQGVADFSGIAGGQSVTYLGGNHTTTNIGEAFAVNNTFDRTYSIEALALTVPEPATVSLLLLGGLGLRTLRRRSHLRA